MSSSQCKTPCPARPLLRPGCGSAPALGTFSNELPSRGVFGLRNTQEAQLPSSWGPPGSEIARETWTGPPERQEGPPVQAPAGSSVSAERHGPVLDEAGPYPRTVPGR